MRHVSACLLLWLGACAEPVTPPPPAPPEAAPPLDESAGARQLAHAEGLLQTGNASAAVTALRAITDVELGPSRDRLLAWALHAAGEPRQLLEHLGPTPAGAELELLAAAAGHALGDAAARERLRDTWRAAPDSTWGLAALYVLAGDARTLTAAERAAVRATLPAPSAASRYADEATIQKRLEALRDEAPRQGRLARELDYAVGVLALRGERFGEAIVALGRVAKSEGELGRSAGYHLAEAHRRRGDYAEAQRGFQQLAGTADRWGLLALAARGQLAIENLRYDEARRLFTEQLLQGPLIETREQALFGLGWVAFRTGAFAEARRFFTAVAAEAPFGPLAPAAVYFGARSAEELGSRELCLGELEALRRRFPTDYYAYRASARLGDARPVPTPLPSPAAPPELTQARAFLDADMPKRAGRTLGALLRRLERQSPDTLQRLEAMLAEAGDGRGQKKVAAARARRFADGPEALVELGRRFPKAPVELLHEAARAERVSPALLVAIAARQSGLVLDKVGSRGELGIFQVPRPPLLALWREANRGRTPANQQLAQGQVATHLGARYLGRLLRGFGSRTEYALAAVHARPGAVTRWREGRGELPGELFVEEIPYAETKSFVKDVLAGVQVQRLLEERHAAVQLAAAEPPPRLPDAASMR